MTSRAKDGLLTLLNYAGGACIYVRVKFSERLRILQSSWAMAHNGETDLVEELEGKEGEDGEGAANESMTSSAAAEKAMKEQRKAEEELLNNKQKKGKGGWLASK